MEGQFQHSSQNIFCNKIRKEIPILSSFYLPTIIQATILRQYMEESSFTQKIGLQQLMIQDLLKLLLDAAMAICPVTGYVLQYRLICRNQSVGAFSIDICLVLLIANILRLNFYPFQHFQTALIFQSLFMIAAQLVLLKACSSFKQQSLTGETSDSQDNSQTFWRWSSFTPYWQSALLFTLVTSIVSLTMYLLEVQAYGEMIGLIGLLTESMLILPQIIQIFKVSSSQGISYYLIILNLLGDTFKTFYFFYTDQPFQFKLCGIIQLILDVFVIVQILYYRMRVRIDQFHEQSQKVKEIDLETKEGHSEDLQGSLSMSVKLSDGSKMDSEVNLD